MAKPFTDYTFEDASELFGKKDAIKGGSPRRPVTAISATAFFEGDHWQKSKGFIGQLPPASLRGADQILANIRDGFVSENVIQEIVETHIGAILGREPLWSFLKEQNEAGQKPPTDDATGEMLTPWWNERKGLKSFQKSAETVLLEGAAVRRIWIPRGRAKPDGVIPQQADIPQALDFIYSQSLTADVAGIFLDPDTQNEVGIYLFEEKDDQGNVTANCAELSFLNKQGETVCRVVKDKGEPQDFGPYQLGRRLLIHEITRRALITVQVQSNQKALNLAHTMMMRNVNLAGARERTVANAQHPKQKIRRQSPQNSNQTVESIEPGTYETGAGAVMFLMGHPIRNEKGDIVGYTNPNVSVSDPAPVKTFTDTSGHFREAIYSQCHQRHVLISGDAAASGRSREQARAEFERSLKETKTVIDAAGRWELETVLRLAAQLANKTSAYLNLRADFNCLIDSGDIDPEKVKVVLEMRKPGGATNTPMISDETARNLVGIDDAEAELKRIEEESKDVEPPTGPPPPEQGADPLPLA